MTLSQHGLTILQNLMRLGEKVGEYRKFYVTWNPTSIYCYLFIPSNYDFKIQSLKRPLILFVI